MKYIKLWCVSYDCDTKFLVELNEEDIKEKIREFYVCPVCESLVFTEGEEIIEIR